MAKATKNTKNLFLFIKILLAIAVGFLCYDQFQKLDFSKEIELSDFSMVSFVLMLGLMPLNYFFEWKKWKAILKIVETPQNNTTDFQAFLAGIITGMLTPNMQGNFLGRMYYYPRRFRAPLILATLWTNLAQFIIALLFGICSIFILNKSFYISLNDSMSWILIAFIGSVFFIYFTFEKWGLGLQKIKFILRFRDLLVKNPFFRIEILCWASLRYITFAFQFLLALHAFGTDFSWEIYFLVWQIYLWTTIAPSLVLGKLFVRESIAIWVLTGIGVGEWNIVAASVSIWIVNLLIPSIIGILVCQKRRKG